MLQLFSACKKHGAYQNPSTALYNGMVVLIWRGGWAGAGRGAGSESETELQGVLRVAGSEQGREQGRVS